MDRTELPLIGIPARLSAYNSESQQHGVKETYPKALSAAGGVPLIIPLGLNESALRALFSRCDGILLAGGEDVDPALYGERAHPKLTKTCKLRDECEALLCKWCMTEKKPLLGICRGFQLMNAALGGNLYQDLPSEAPSEVTHSHNPHESHLLNLNPRSRLAALLGNDKLLVNSRHHQAVKELAPGLIAAGRSDDGIIEAAEATGNQFLFGLQCHPEDLWGTSQEWKRLFSEFVAACRIK